MLMTSDMLPGTPAIALALVVAYLVWRLSLARTRTHGGDRIPAPTEPEKPMPRARKKQPPSNQSRAEIARRLAAVRSWGYQLQNLNVAAAAVSDFDLLVIDYARDGSDATALKPRDLERLKQHPGGGERLVYAYISVGEAESYRYYWHDEWKKAPPEWLLGENRDWRENYRVAFWDEAWQRILWGSAGGGSADAYIDRIAAAGFDGLYLDRCDVFEDLARLDKAAAKTRRDLEGDMADFIVRLAAYVRREHPQLGIIMQNAENLLERAPVRQAIDAIAKEELLYGESGGSRRNSKAVIADNRAALDLLRADGKPVFVVEYLDDAAKKASAREEVTALGYVPYVSRANRDLASLEAVGDSDGSLMTS